MKADAQAVAPVKVLLVDDHPAVRQGLALLLVPEGIVVAGQADCMAEALEAAQAASPDVALVDISLADGEDGLAVAAELHRREIPVLVYSMHDDARHVQRALAAGALGYVTKREGNLVLVEAIRQVAAGRRFLSLRAATVLAQHVSMPPEQGGHRVLSSQERQVYELLGRGEGTIEIAAAMDISTRTVESYYARIQNKLDFPGMLELRRHAIKHCRHRPE